MNIYPFRCRSNTIYRMQYKQILKSLLFKYTQFLHINYNSFRVNFNVLPKYKKIVFTEVATSILYWKKQIRKHVFQIP